MSIDTIQSTSIDFLYAMIDSCGVLQVVPHHCRHRATAVMASLSTACVPAGLYAYTSTVTWTSLIVANPPTLLPYRQEFCIIFFPPTSHTF